MRIIAGEWRGRKLVAPSGELTRPTADRTRETLFSMLTSRLGSFEGLSVLDLFAGSGALGLEALSRGAASCLFVEQESPAIKAIRSNIDALDARTRSTVQQASVMSLGPAKSRTMSSCWIRRMIPAQGKSRWTGCCGLAGSERRPGWHLKQDPGKILPSRACKSTPNARSARQSLRFCGWLLETAKGARPPWQSRPLQAKRSTQGLSAC